MSNSELETPILSIENVSKRFVKSLDLAGKIAQKLGARVREEIVHAVDGVSIEIKDGEVVGLVGESGCGKSTLGRVVAGVHGASDGRVLFKGQDVADLEGNEAREAALKIQMIFQDPYSSLNGRLKVKDIVAEPILLHNPSIKRSDLENYIFDLLQSVELSQSSAERYPHEFSGGQRQRISIARALATQPRLLVCDEPTSALDVSIQAQILNLLKDLQEQLNLTILFISHDLPVVRQMCDRIAVLKNGSICEISETEKLFNQPNHDYTKELIKLMPKIESIYK